MGLFDLLRRRAPVAETQPPQIQEDAEEKNVRIIRGGTFAGQQLAKQLTGGRETPADPAQLIAVSRLIVELIPELYFGLALHLQVMGSIEGIETEDEAFAAEFRAWAESVMWCGEVAHPFDKSTGLDELIRLVAWEAMITGMGFLRAVDRDGADNTLHRQGDPVIRVHEPTRFTFVEFAPDRFQLDYESGGQIYQDIKPGDFLRSLSFERKPDQPWGIPMTARAIEAARIHLRTQQNHLQSLDLTASAALATLISMQPPPSLLESDLKTWYQERKEAQQIVSDMVDRLVAGINTSKATGQRYQAFAATTSEIKLETISLAQGVTINPKYTEDRKAMLSSVVIGAGIQPEFVGLTTQGGGLGDQKWQTAARAMSGTGMRIRNPVWNLIKHFFELHCKRKSIMVRPGYAPIWKGLQLTEESVVLAAKKIEAEIAEKHAQNAALLFEQFGTVAANAYIEANGLPYKAIG